MFYKSEFRVLKFKCMWHLDNSSSSGVEFIKV